MATCEVDRHLVGAYGKDRKEFLKFQSTLVQTQRIQQIRQEEVRRGVWDKKRNKGGKLFAGSASPEKHAKLKDSKKAARLTRLIEIRAGYYEAELLKELKLRKEAVEEDVEEADVIPVYKEYRPTYPNLSPRHVRIDRPQYDASPRQSNSVNRHSEKAYDRTSPTSSFKAKLFTSPLKATTQRTESGLTALNRSLATTEEKVVQAEQDQETRRQRMLERSILELDLKLARLTHHRHSSSVGEEPKPGKGVRRH